MIVEPEVLAVADLRIIGGGVIGRMSIDERMRRFARQDGECVIWTGSIATTGYGRLRVKGRQFYVHRLAYERANGPIPDGLVIDHLCRNRLCVNPDHLEAVTNKENILRGVGSSAANARKTHCKKGHPLSGGNLVMRVSSLGHPYRECRACNRAMQERGTARRLAERSKWVAMPEARREAIRQGVLRSHARRRDAAKKQENFG